MSKNSRPIMGQAGSLGFTFVAMVLIFTAASYFLDRWLRTTPWLMVGGVFLGAALGFAYLVATLLTETPEKRHREDHEEEGAGKSGRPES